MPTRDKPMLLAGGLLTLALLVVVLVSSIAGTHPDPSPGCKRVTVAMSTGGATIERCGAQRR